MAQRIPEPGEVIGGKYVVEHLLGRGGMGAVFVVTHQGTGKRLALKCLLPEHHDDVDIEARFLREAQAAGRIQHRHVVDVFDVGKDGELLYMVMPLLEGRPLSQLLKDEQLTLEETIGILARAMEGVGAAHAQGIVHRDLKPDNIFVCVGPSGRLDDPRVLDFGISKRSDDISRPLTRSGVMMGTPYYMSFEQINSQRDLDQRVDVYAMGVILYEAISGVLPHRAESIGQLAIRMMGTPPQDLGVLRPDLPPGLADVVMKAIARDREDRYGSVHEFIDALKPYYLGRRSSLVPADGGTPLHGVGRVSLAPGNRGEDPTVPFRSSEHPSGSADRFRGPPSPLPQPLRATSHGEPRSGPRLLRGNLGDLTPPRVIAPSSGRGFTIFLAALLGLGGAGAFWMYRSGVVGRGAGVDKSAAAAPSEEPAAPAAQGSGEPAEPPSAEGDPGAAEQAEAQPAAAEKPKKHRHKRRRVVRTTTASDGKPRQVVLFIEESDAGEREVAPDELTEEEKAAVEAKPEPDAEPASPDEVKAAPADVPAGNTEKPASKDATDAPKEAQKPSP